MRPAGFMLVLVGKDGGIKLRKPSPWDVREITRSIDKMPMRQREIREQGTGKIRGRRIARYRHTSPLRRWMNSVAS